MKKIFFFLSLLISLKGFSQLPQKQTIGTDSTEVNIKGATKTKLINYIFTDTSAANLTRIKQYPGAQIFTSSDNKLWLRNSTATEWIISGGNGVSVINIITDSSISICNFNSCDTFYTTVTAQRVTILNDSTLQVCDTLNVCDTLHIPRTQFFQNLWDSTTVYQTINDLRTYIYDTSFTNQFMPNGVKVDTVYDVSDSVNNIRRFVFSDNRTYPPTITTWDDTLIITLNQSNITSIQNIINYIRDSLEVPDTTFHLTPNSANDGLDVEVTQDSVSTNDTLKYTQRRATTTLGGYLHPTDFNIFNNKEPALGNPASNGYVLSSTTGGVRSWVAQSGGGGSQGLQDVITQDNVLTADNDIVNNGNSLVVRMDANSGTSSGSYVEFNGQGGTGSKYLDINFNHGSQTTGNGTNIAYDGFHTYSFHNVFGVSTNFDIRYNRATLQRSSGLFDGIVKDIVTSVNGTVADSTGNITISTGGGNQVTGQEFTGSTSTTLTLSQTYLTGTIRLYKNGVRLLLADFTEASPTTITLNVARLSGDVFTADFNY